MQRRQLLTLGITTTVAAGIGGIASRKAFEADLDRAKARLGRGSVVFDSRYGQMEYAVEGTGPPCVMIHGTGGGFDQGLGFAARLVAAGRQIIAPSRFGYLRSAFPADPSSEAQADAIVDLLDHLGIARVPVIGGSAGALSAMQFAIRHPDRCSALVTLVPAAYTPDRAPPPPPNALAASIITYGLQSDYLFWCGLKLAEDAMIGALLATDPALAHAAAPHEQARVRAILHDILPVSLRVQGLLNDGKLSGAPKPMSLEAITVPTFVASVEDDRFGTAAPARFIAASVPGAELVIYPIGGHVWVGHDADLMARVDGFLRTT